MKSLSRLFVFVLVVGMFGTMAYAEDAAKTAPVVDEKAAAEQAKKEEMMKRMSPTDAHKILEPLAGKWTAVVKMWMTPEAKADEMTGTGENTIIYGGRFLKQEFKGTWMGQPFEGTGYTGYDVIKGEYISIWIDSMATGIMTASGQYDATSKTLGTSGANSCPLTGEKDRKGRAETKIIDNDHNVYSSYAAGPDGKEFKMMEITYTRVA